MRVLQICNGLKNVGDLLAPIITSKLTGASVDGLFKTLPEGYAGEPILAGLGSFLGYYGDWPLHVWGTGFEPGYMDRHARAYCGGRPGWRFFAVRGYLTRMVFHLDENVIVGDPAIVMPRIYEPKAHKTERVRYFLHCDNDEPPEIGVDVEICTTRMDPFRAIDLIAGSSFVFTEALHIAILAYAYGVPWAWSLNKHLRGLFKWFDWFSSIGVAARWFPPSALVQATRWFDESHRGFLRLDPTALIDAFPEEVLLGS